MATSFPSKIGQIDPGYLGYGIPKEITATKTSNVENVTHSDRRQIMTLNRSCLFRCPKFGQQS
jgi:hypothetical protein